MDTKKSALNAAGTIFFLVAVLHLLRFVFHVPVIIGSYAVPSWPSLVLAIAAFLLSVWMFKSIR
ncbi:MAG: hypothetical protein A3C35_00015 [Omnitrophica bacterium RIFCSPHIGHO2_02_FULL_46_11]|nr:MAG: hypothetical protein A3C35_00015 [Omnitrophica bacterium RIFCSPHIGHO2_02_FULL_46_11]OGW86463.1 MAG: hypothetical protein A3A81_02740 [Omnitrophica bacterium RIFCSPLOWO2_01_FULL_45_10b]